MFFRNPYPYPFPYPYPYPVLGREGGLGDHDPIAQGDGEGVGLPGFGFFEGKSLVCPCFPYIFPIPRFNSDIFFRQPEINPFQGVIFMPSRICRSQISDKGHCKIATPLC